MHMILYFKGKKIKILKVGDFFLTHRKDILNFNYFQHGVDISRF